MLVCANVLKPEESDVFDVADRAIHGWLVYQLDKKLPYTGILKMGEWLSD